MSSRVGPCIAFPSLLCCQQLFGKPPRHDTFDKGQAPTNQCKTSPILTAYICSQSGDLLRSMAVASSLHKRLSYFIKSDRLDILACLACLTACQRGARPWGEGPSPKSSPNMSKSSLSAGKRSARACSSCRIQVFTGNSQ